MFNLFRCHFILGLSDGLLTKMNAVISLCHFCEVHGPSILFCTQAFHPEEDSQQVCCLSYCFKGIQYKITVMRNKSSGKWRIHVCFSVQVFDKEAETEEGRDVKSRSLLTLDGASTASAPTTPIPSKVEKCEVSLFWVFTVRPA